MGALIDKLYKNKWRLIALDTILVTSALGLIIWHNQLRITPFAIPTDWIEHEANGGDLTFRAPPDVRKIEVKTLCRESFGTNFYLCLAP